MKKILALVLALAAMLIVSGCGGNAPAKEIDINEVVDALENQITYQDSLSPLTDDMFNSVYMLDASLIKNAVAYVSTGATAEEIIAIELTDESAADTVKAAMEDHLVYLKEGYADYGPQEVPKIEDAVLTVSGKYVFLSISDDSAKAKEIIDSFVK